MRRAQQARTRYRQCESRFEIGLRTVVLRGHAPLALCLSLSLSLGRSLSLSNCGAANGRARACQKMPTAVLVSGGGE